MRGRTESSRRLNGGEGGIRTPDTVSGMPVFKTGVFNRSTTSPLGNCFYSFCHSLPNSAIARTVSALRMRM